VDVLVGVGVGIMVRVAVWVNVDVACGVGADCTPPSLARYASEYPALVNPPPPKLTFQRVKPVAMTAPSGSTVTE
jgi:hypothetical protein